MLPCDMLSGELSPDSVCAEAARNEKDQARPAARQPAEQTSNRRRMRPPSRATRSRQQPRAPLHLAFLERVSPSHYHPRIERYGAERDPPPHEPRPAAARYRGSRQVSQRDEREERG